MSAEMKIRTLNSSDAQDFQRLRLFALQESPAAFSSSYQQEVDNTLGQISERLAPIPEWAWVLGVFTANDVLIALAGFRRERGVKESHKAAMWGMYVAPPYRGQGIARRLLIELISRAKSIPGLLKLDLSVNPTQSAARHLYASLGFVPFGHERDALQIGGRY